MSEDVWAELRAEKEALQAKMRALAEERLKPLLAALLVAAPPEIRAVSWQQYTPSWNDGDPCTFSVHSPELRFSEEIEAKIQEAEIGGDSSRDGEWFSEWSIQYHSDPARYPNVSQLPISAEVATAARGILKKIEEVPEDVMELAFGDPAEVLVDRTGISVEECEHD